MKPVHTTSQLTLDFQPGLTERYDSALDCVRACVHTNVKPLKAIAAEMDLSSSDLSRKLSCNPDDPRRFTLSDLEGYVQVTGDVTPILYLAQKYCADETFKQKEALAALANLAPQIASLLKAAGVK